MPATCLAVVSALAAPRAAGAGGFAVARFGGEHGHVATEHPTSIYFNPAGMALGSGWRIYAEGIFAYRSVDYTRPEAAIDHVREPGDTASGTPEDAVDANSGTAKLRNVITSPFLAAITDLGVPNLAVGIGVYAPFGGQASWDKNSEFEGSTMYPGAEDGVQRWSTIEGELRSIYLTAAGAYRLPGPRLSFGLGVHVIRSNLWTVRARNAAGTDDMVSGSGDLLEGRSEIETSGTHLGAGAGVMWEPAERVWIGASYQSKPGFGERHQSGTLRNKLGTLAVEESDIHLVQTMPDIVRLGGRWQPNPQLELRLSGEIQRWSSFDKQCFVDASDDSDCALDGDGAPADGATGIVVNIPRWWKDSYGVRGGASYWITPGFEVNGGLNFDTSAVPDKTVDASLLDQNKLIALAGVRWDATEFLRLALTLNNVFYFKRTVKPRSASGSDDLEAPQTPSTVPDGGGTYKQNVFYVNLATEFLF
ncbi:MAG TPA: outer membrane protein transport protein [Kofleriaceae bacterium]|nr:outer membrane protein transport protein [Kofleriaceae bacterium]